MARTLTCGEALVRLLRAYGVDTVFGIPGVHTLELYRGLEGSGIRHILARHEQGAGFMADGYARVSGRPGVCFVITGPGVTNVATPMGQAYSDSVPMLVISSVNATGDLGKGLGKNHEITNQRAVTAPLTAFSATAFTPESLPDLVARAFSVFRSERPRPVHIEVPIDVLAKPVDADWQVRRPPRRSSPVPEAVAEAARLLATAERPAIIAGGGALDAGQALAKIAETTGAGVVTTVAAKGLIAESHPLSLGATLDLKPTQEWLAKADVVLAIGTELAESDRMCDHLPLPGRIIRIDIDAAKVTDCYPAEVGIVADAAPTAAAVMAVLDQGDRRNRPPPETDSITSVRAENAKPATPQIRKHVLVLDALRRALPENGIVMTDMTQIAYTGNNAFKCERPRTWFHPVGFAALGFALPATIGAALGAPGRPLVALFGDLGLLFTVQELATAVELEIPLVLLLWNNDGLGAIRRKMAERKVRSHAADMKNPDFLALARSFGCHAARPRSLDEMEKAIKKGLRARAPTLIEVREDSAFFD